MATTESIRKRLGAGLVIPACPLALTARRQLDERRQRALCRYYLAAGAGGLAVGVHTTQFAIRDAKVGLLKPVLALAAEEMTRAGSRGVLPGSSSIALRVQSPGRVPVWESPSPSPLPSPLGRGNSRGRSVPIRMDVPSAPLSDPSQRGPEDHLDPSVCSTVGEGFSLSPRERAGVRGNAAADNVNPVRIAGICGGRRQALAEAALVRELGYHAGLLSLGAWRDASEDAVLDHCRAVAEIIPLFGFYLQPAAGGRLLSYPFWRRFAEIENVVAIKIAPFNRYQTLDVVRAIAEAGREDIALYTGNDDSIVLDLLTPYRVRVGRRFLERRIVGGLLGHWAVWTRRAVELHVECRRLVVSREPIPPGLLQRAVEVTDCNAAFFDAAHHYAGCIPGIHEVLRRQGLLAGIWCLDPSETLSPGQREEIGRVCRAYPHLSDDEFVRRHREEWLNG